MNSYSDTGQLGQKSAVERIPFGVISYANILFYSWYIILSPYNQLEENEDAIHLTNVAKFLLITATELVL
jgi:hypothetical protein